jgi:hypothetical protein
MSYFVDTCVYINYGVSLDIFHKESVAFFDIKEKKHTSESVISELQDFESFLAKFGRDLNVALNQGRRRDVLKYPETVFRGYGENARNYIRRFLELVKNRKAEDILKEYRSTKALTLALISDALSKTQNPFVIQSTDQKFIQLISYVNDDADAQIIADAVLWAMNYPYRKFCTSDNEHILKNKTPLEVSITNNYGRNCLIFVHVKDV